MSTTDLRIHAPAKPSSGELVLYWMQVTLRSTENFALNYAVERANELRLPVLVYQGLRPDYPWASARLHTFILESALDLRDDFASRGIQYVFHLDRNSPIPREDRTAETGRLRHDASPLIRLAERAALVVTDFYPTFIVPRQTLRLRRALAERAIASPVVAVDSATVVPMAAFDRAYSTARAFRPVLFAALPHYLHPVPNPEPVVRRNIDPGFESALGPEIDHGHIARLVGLCPVDQSVPPALEIRGGSRAARNRLNRFLSSGLPRYSRNRNDPNEDATSGLSPYLHFGNISPQEILLGARETGPEEEFGRFQDEMLTWRELAHNFVYHDPRHRTVDAIPEWARKELSEHAADPRPVLYSLEQLEHARTGDPLWNAAQTAYLRNGYMHNYLRMLWGKAVLQWTPGYGEALHILEHLNNKYSLDGRDANSYAGIMWIFGKFDRPFYRRPIYGLVRYQSLKAAAKKFNVTRYIERQEIPSLL
ncbi:MAG: deoxyribodipyrimidine photo-lyase [Gemmatimonadota bacterium]